MSSEISKLSLTGRRAAANLDWATVETCATEILRLHESDAEGHFLKGLVEKVSSKPAKATESFERVLKLDPSRYDAAIELAGQHSIGRRNSAAAELIERYEAHLGNSPKYLDMAGTVYTEIGLPHKAWPLYQKANRLQPGVDLFQANLAACGVFLGKIEEAKAIYTSLLRRFPTHQRNHYQLSRLEKARDDAHILQMKAVLQTTRLSEDKNIFIYYAIGKELEDLGRWSEAFEYYKKAGDAVASVADYDIVGDLQLIETIISVCTPAWLGNNAVLTPGIYPDKTPIFIVGLPRTGTTLTERIIASHSQVESLGETQFLQMVLRRESGIRSVENVNSEILQSAATKDITAIGRGYLDAVAYRLGDKRMFIEKLPFNFLFLGFIAKAYPHARIIYQRRNPLDSCFAMYKQVFTWAYKFSYRLDWLGQYYVAHDRLSQHWRQVLGDRLVEVEYEALVSNQEAETRRLLDKIGLPFEEACLDFDKNATASTTASSVQVREKIHSGSVRRWTRFAAELQPLKSYLEDHGISVD